MKQKNDNYDNWVFLFIGILLVCIGGVQVFHIYPLFQTLAKISYEMTIKGANIFGYILVLLGVIFTTLSIGILIFSWGSNREGNGNREGNDPAN
jgi:hypothetical protein